MAKIAIIGAAGFVGMELVKHMQHQHEVVAVARNNGKFLLQNLKCTIVHPSDVQRSDDFDVVINLAYPTSGLVHYYPNRNREILAMIEKLAGAHAHIIHVSTIAVFGFQLDHPVDTVPVQPRKDYLYVESKIELEEWLRQKFSGRSMDIVRLGNVWGEGSGAWTAPLIDKMLFGSHVGVAGYDGYCNVTDVANVVSYLTFLSTAVHPTGIAYHHLAEFSHLRWSYWIDKIKKVINANPVYGTTLPKYSSSLRYDIKNSMAPFKPRTFYKRLVEERFAGSVLRQIVRLLPEERFARLKSHNVARIDLSDNIAPADETFLIVMSCMRQFELRTLPEWTPPVSLEESWSKIEHWMSEIGYTE